MKHNYLLGSARRTEANEIQSSLRDHKDRSPFPSIKMNYAGQWFIAADKGMQNETLSRHQPVSTNSVPKSCPVKEWVKCHVSGPRVDGQGLGGVEGKARAVGSRGWRIVTRRLYHWVWAKGPLSGQPELRLFSNLSGKSWMAPRQVSRT